MSVSNIDKGIRRKNHQKAYRKAPRKCYKFDLAPPTPRGVVMKVVLKQSHMDILGMCVKSVEALGRQRARIDTLMIETEHRPVGMCRQRSQ